MIPKIEISRIIKDYDLKNIKIGVIGSHSALDVCDGANDEGIPSLVVAQKGRDLLYTKYFNKRVVNGMLKGAVDSTIVVDKFADMKNVQFQQKLTSSNVIFVPNRSFAVYTGIDYIENEFKVPLVGSRDMLRIENRESEVKNYYWVAEKAGIRIPPEYKSPREIDDLVMVKLPHAKHKLERGFFTAASFDEYKKKSKLLIERGVITEEDLKTARIERYIMGPVFNFNFFYSPIDREVELLGIDWRFESNLDGMVRIPAGQQLELPKKMQEPIMTIVGHSTATLRESLLDRVYIMAEKFVEFSQKEYAKGIIGPFCLQTIVDENTDFWVYDIATRIGGGTNIHMFEGHPYANTLFRKRMSSGRRLALEVKRAIELNMLSDIVT